MKFQFQQSPLILTELTEHKKGQHMMLETQVLACLGQAQKCGGVKPVNGIP